MTKPRTQKLTAKQQAFVVEYMKDFDAKAAVLRAGYRTRWPVQMASGLLKKIAVADAIEEQSARAETRILLDADRVVRELEALAFSDIRTYLTERADGSLALKPRAELSERDTAAIASLSLGGRHRPATIKLFAKVAALRALAQHLGLHEQRHYVDPKEQNRMAMEVFMRLCREAEVELPPGLLRAP
jgi:phage terminase small subunit